MPILAAYPLEQSQLPRTVLRSQTLQWWFASPDVQPTTDAAGALPRQETPAAKLILHTRVPRPHAQSNSCCSPPTGDPGRPTRQASRPDNKKTDGPTSAAPDTHAQTLLKKCSILVLRCWTESNVRLTLDFINHLVDRTAPRA